jgi:curli biogenesis system outer membrane secretion channel CsgG
MKAFKKSILGLPLLSPLRGIQSHRFKTRALLKPGAIKGFLGWLILGTFFLYYGCAAPGQPTAKLTHTEGPSVAEAQREKYDGPKARIAVGDFQVKAAGATYEIGDGLREMLVTALFNGNRFIVLDRQAIQDIMLEQELGASGRVKEETAPSIGQLEGAEILVYGVVSEFKLGSGGIGLNLGMPNLPLLAGAGAKNSHLAIDLRAVDTSTGRVVFATRVEGKATDYSARVGTRIGGGSTEMPVALGAYKNTPMEKAIRVCIDSAAEYLGTKTPAQCFHYQE